jgi:hypothetical protein
MYSVRALNGLIRIYFKTKRCLVRCSNGVPHEVADTIRSRDVQVVFVHRFVSGHDLQVLVQPHHALKQIIGWCNFVLDRCLCGHALHNFAEIAVCARTLPLLRHSLFLLNTTFRKWLNQQPHSTGVLWVSVFWAVYASCLYEPAGQAQYAQNATGYGTTAVKQTHMEHFGRCDASYIIV